MDADGNATTHISQCIIYNTIYHYSAASETRITSRTKALDETKITSTTAPKELIEEIPRISSTDSGADPFVGYRDQFTSMPIPASVRKPSRRGSKPTIEPSQSVAVPWYRRPFSSSKQGQGQAQSQSQVPSQSQLPVLPFPLPEPPSSHPFPQPPSSRRHPPPQPPSHPLPQPPVQADVTKKPARAPPFPGRSHSQNRRQNINSSAADGDGSAGGHIGGRAVWVNSQPFPPGHAGSGNGGGNALGRRQGSLGPSSSNNGHRPKPPRTDNGNTGGLDRGGGLYVMNGGGTSPYRYNDAVEINAKTGTIEKPLPNPGGQTHTFSHNGTEATAGATIVDVGHVSGGGNGGGGRGGGRTGTDIIFESEEVLRLNKARVRHELVQLRLRRARCELEQVESIRGEGHHHYSHWQTCVEVEVDEIDEVVDDHERLVRVEVRKKIKRLTEWVDSEYVRGESDVPPREWEELMGWC